MDQSIIRALTCGSVDDGKSTLIGRLLVATDSIPEDTMAAARFTRRSGSTVAVGEIDYSLLTDGLEAEREQGITIDVAYRSMSLGEDKRLILADAPGHEQYTRNMAVAASRSDIALVLVDASKGVRTQTLRHLTICAMMAVSKIIFIINKMDLVNFDNGVFEDICKNLEKAVTQHQISTAEYLPVCALSGDNLIAKSEKMNWYQGKSLLELLTSFHPEQNGSGPTRMDIELSKRFEADRIIYGSVFGGGFKVGQALLLWPAKQQVEIEKIYSSKDAQFASDQESVAIKLKGEVDAPKADLLTSLDYPLEYSNKFSAKLIWLNENPLIRSRSYLLISGAQSHPVTVTEIKHQITLESNELQPSATLSINQVGEIEFVCDRPIPLQSYSVSRQYGNFVLVDRSSKESVGAGMVITAITGGSTVTTHQYEIGKEQRSAQKGQVAKVIWLTGLSGSGKSTIADELAKQLFGLDKHVYVLDGDNLRSGLNMDLSFTAADRAENVRRVAQVAKIMVDAGLIVVVALVSPFQADRAAAKELFEESEFIEVFVNTPIEVCAKRDSKGLYKKANTGGLSNLSGVGQEYEPPIKPDLEMSGDQPIAQSVAMILQKVMPNGNL